MVKRVDIFPAKVKSIWFKDHWLAVTVLFLLVFLMGGAVVLAQITHSTPQAILTNEKKLSAAKGANLKKDLLPQNQVAETISQKLKAEDFTGTALIVQNGQIIMNQGYGFSDYQRQTHNNARTVYHLASSAKFLTAILIGRAVAEKKLAYTDHLDQFYPNVVDASQISIRDLLTMTSTLQQKSQPTTFTSDADNVQFSADHTNTTEATIGAGAGWSYQPVNYRLLAGILMKIYGQSFDQLVQDYYNQDFHLKIDNVDQFADDKNAAQGYQSDLTVATGITKVENQRETGTGNLAMTAGMLYRSYWLFFNGQFFKNPLSLMDQHLPAHYVSGLYRYGDIYTSHGIINGYEPSIVLGKNGENAVILLANQYYRGHSFEPLSHELYQTLTGVTVPR